MIPKDNIFGGQLTSTNGMAEERIAPCPSSSDNSRIRPEDVDFLISAEIPDPSEDPELHRLVLARMIHGPCGNTRLSHACFAREGQ